MINSFASMPNKANLTKLAEGLMTVPDDQFAMSNYTRITDVDEFEERHAEYAQFIRDKEGVDSIAHETLSPDFKIEHGCATSGCALGWAPALVVPGKRQEDYDDYCVRVFGIVPQSYEWYFMFGPEWTSENNTPIETAKRIMYYVETGDVPKGFRTANVASVCPTDNDWDYDSHWQREE